MCVQLDLELLLDEPQRAVEQIVGKLPLADYLRAGRRELRGARVSLDRLWRGA